MVNEKRYSELIRARRSVRTFDGKGISDDIMEQLRVFAANCPNPYDIPMEFRFLNAKEHGLKSPVIAGTDEYVAVKLKRVPGFEEALGYSLEKFVLDAWSVGIGTTWIGGTMDRPAFERAMELADDEIMPCVSPIGHAARRMSLKEIAMRKGVGADRRKPFEELFFAGGFDQPLTEAKAGQLAEGKAGQPTGVKSGQLLLPLQMVRLAPSAVNKQPQRLQRLGGRRHAKDRHGDRPVSFRSGRGGSRTGCGWRRVGCGAGDLRSRDPGAGEDRVYRVISLWREVSAIG